MLESFSEISVQKSKKETVSDVSLLESNLQKEDQAERDLDALLAKVDNKFLLEIQKNREIIENADTAVEALEYARHQIDERMKKTFHFEAVGSVEGIAPLEASYTGMQQTVERVLLGAREIGRGGDAFVVIDRNEIREFPPEICYKFAIAEKTPRGRNTHIQEAEIQGKFFDIAQHIKSKVGVPAPFYSLEIGDKKIIAMEKLQAASIDDILRGRGILPEWFEIDDFCEELKKLLDSFHEHDLYHRDMHLGNIMISQAALRSDAKKLGYVIDFGLSSHSVSGFEAYKKEVAGDVFTYDDDYGIMTTVKKQLHDLRKRKYDGII